MLLNILLLCVVFDPRAHEKALVYEYESYIDVARASRTGVSRVAIEEPSSHWLLLTSMSFSIDLIYDPAF